MFSQNKELGLMAFAAVHMGVFQNLPVCGMVDVRSREVTVVLMSARTVAGTRHPAVQKGALLCLQCQPDRPSSRPSASKG